MKKGRHSKDGPNCAVFDAGKTFTKVSVVTSAGEVLAESRILTPTLRTQTYTAIDTDTIFEWLLSQLKALSGYGIDRIIPVAHGAACALLDAEERLVLPVQDYESPIPGAITDAYARLRPGFSETLSPALPKGLNLGAQIYWHSQRDPALFARVRWILPYPQYWAWRLSGALCSEVTSLGCHSDLWAPAQGGFSSLARSQGWAERFAPMRKAWETVGTVRAPIARACGLPESTRVCAGLHDTNAALAALTTGRHADTAAPAVLSTGTWFIAMAPGAPLDTLQAERDCLGAVDVFGRPVPCARFMGGRAFEMIARGGTGLDVDEQTLSAVMRESAFALPSFLDAGGPYPGHRGEIRDLRSDCPQTRGALGLLYQALVSTTCLDMIQAGRTLLIEGRAARNPMLCGLIAALHDGPVFFNVDTSGVTLGAAALAYRGEAPPPRLTHQRAKPFLGQEIRAYRNRWTQAVNESAVA